MSEIEKDFCLECGVEVFDGGSWGYCVPCGNAVFDKLVAEGVITREEIERVKVEHNAMLDQTVPFGTGSRLKPLNRTPNHAVGEVYKPTALNTHDPDNQYRWADEGEGWLIWTGRALFSVGFLVGIYALCLLTFLF